MRPILKGSTDQSVVIRIVDSTDGTPENSVVFNTSGIDLWYRREGAARVSITEATLSALTDAHSDGGFLFIGDGYYRLDSPDAAFATGADGVLFGGTVTGMVVIGCYVPLQAINIQDGVRQGLTALPNAAAEAAGGLYTRGTGAGQINQANNGQIDSNAARTGGTTNTGRDLGASVLLSPGTGTGQISLSSGAVTAGTVSDKTGYGLSSAAVQAIWDALTSALTTANTIGRLLVDNINATISSRLAGASYTAPLDAAGTRSAVGLGSANLDTQLAALPTAAENADAVWDETAADHVAAGSTGEALADAGGAGTPPTAAEVADAVWDEARADHTTNGTFGQGVASVQGNVTGSVASLTTNNDKTGYGLSSAAIQAVWDALTSALTTVGSIGRRIADNLDVVLSTRLASGSYTTPPTAVENRTEMDSNSTRLADIDGKTAPLPSDPADASVVAGLIAGLNNISEAQILTQVNAALDASVAEQTSVPAANASIRAGIKYLFTWRRNRKTQTNSVMTLRNDANNADIATSAVSDDGTTLIIGEDA